MLNLIFTDLDGTLLDHDTYSWDAARPALDLLRRRNIPVVIVTSKTRAEVMPLRDVLENRHPFITENGGAAYFPIGYFPLPAAGSTIRGDYEVLEWGAPYAELAADLQRASELSGCRVRGFHQMDIAEIASACGLSEDAARLAAQREYDEPFLVLDPDRSTGLMDAIRELGRQVTRGGRFWHIFSGSDKARAVDAVTYQFRRFTPTLGTIGLGDGLNDAGFLNRVQVPVLVRSSMAAVLQLAVPRGRVTKHAGPQGWNDALLALLGP